MPEATVTLDSIARAGEALIDADGGLGPDLHRLCHALDCTEAALVRLFPGGLGQIERVLRVRVAALLSDRLAAAEADDAIRFADLAPDSAALRLVRRARGFLEGARACPGRHRFLFSPDRTGAATTPALVLVARFADLIQAAAQSRELTRPSIGRGEAEASAALLLAYLHGVAELSVAGLVPNRPEQVIRVLVEALGRAGFAVARHPAALEAAARATPSARPAITAAEPLVQPAVAADAQRGAA